MHLNRLAPLHVAVMTGLLSTHAFASATNEYTLSAKDMPTTVTSYQPQTYTPAVAQPAPVMAVPVQTIPVQPAPMQATPMMPSEPQIGEIIFNTEPYMPDATSVETTTTIMQPFSGTTQPTMIQPLAPVSAN